MFRRRPDLMEALFKAAPAERDFPPLTTTSLLGLREMVSVLPLDTAMLLFTRLAAETWHMGNDNGRQLALVREIFPPDAPVVQSIERFLNEHDGAAFFIEYRGPLRPPGREPNRAR